MSPQKSRFSGKQAKAHIVPLKEWCGSAHAVSELQKWLALGTSAEDSDTLIVGEPGTGTTGLAVSYLRERLADPTLGHRTEIGIFKQVPHSKRDFIRIDGGSISTGHLESLVESAKEPAGDDHTYVVLSQADVLFARGLETRVLSLLAHPRVTTFATANAFRRPPNMAEVEFVDRARAFLGEFPIRLRTEKPTAAELFRHLAQLILTWGITVDNEQTVGLLVRKSGCVVGRARNALIYALANNGGVLDFNVVARYDADPLLLC